MVAVAPPWLCVVSSAAGRAGTGQHRRRRRARTGQGHGGERGRPPSPGHRQRRERSKHRIPLRAGPVDVGGRSHQQKSASPESHVRHPRDASGPAPGGRRPDGLIRLGIVIAKIPGEQGLSTNPPRVVRCAFADKPQFGQARGPVTDVTSPPTASGGAVDASVPRLCGSAGGVSQLGSGCVGPQRRRLRPWPRAGRPRCPAPDRGRSPPRRCPPTSSSAPRARRSAPSACPARRRARPPSSDAAALVASCRLAHTVKKLVCPSVHVFFSRSQ